MRKKLLFAFTALFGLMQFAAAEKPVDVTSTYLKNAKQPFAHTDEALVPGTISVNSETVNRFVKLTEWQTAGDVGDMGVSYTGWYLDRQKDGNKGAIGLCVGWDGMADYIEDAKVFQTVTLPAGKYNFVTYFAQDGKGKENVYLVANKGAVIPDTANLASEALAYRPLRTLTAQHPDTIVFELAAETQISLGCVATFPLNDEGTSNKMALFLKEFKLIKIEPGTDYSPLINALANADKITATTHPEGNSPGKYPTAIWDAFKAAREAARAIVDTEMSAPKTDEQIAEATATLKAAVTAFLNGVIPPFKYSTATEEFWYELLDNRADKPAHMYMGLDGETSLDGRLIYTKNVEEIEDPDAKFFKFVQKDGAKFYIYNKAYPDQKIAYTPETGVEFKNVIGAFDNPEKETWTIGKSDIANYFVIQLVGVPDPNMLNSFNNAERGYIGLYNSLSDRGNQWYFKKEIKEGYADFTELFLYLGKLDDVTTEKFPVGDGLAQYSQAAWDNLAALKAQAIDMLAKQDELPQPTQDEVDAKLQSLKDAYAALAASMSAPFTLSTPEKEVWYKVKDRRATPNYWIYNVETNRLAITKTYEEGNDAFAFKFVKPEGETSTNKFLIYAKLAADPHAITYAEEDANNLHAGLSAESDTLVFTAKRTPSFNKEYFRLATVSMGKQLNSHQDTDKMFVGFYAPAGEDAGNDWKFESLTESSVKNTTAIDLGIYVRGRMVVSKDEYAVLNVYNVSGQRVNALRELTPGVYVVTVKGKAGAAKVVVR